MDDVIAFLRARVDEDEKTALTVPVGEPLCHPPAHWLPGADPGGEKRWVMGTFKDIDAHTVEAAEHIARHDPARVLREVEAKRQLLDRHMPGEYGQCVTCHVGAYSCGCCSWGDFPCDTVRLLALAYADHKEFRREWRP
ncbi:DUF6221 family protein [Nonomuraea sp. GTA35]|uniref:DUF6221 family protein n=1 Tax=Nonomuraea sp. GTA35 TaxID=1676746 RepID=UPI0035C2462E